MVPVAGIPPPVIYQTRITGYINSFRPVGMFISVSQQFLPVTGLFITKSLITLSGGYIQTVALCVLKLCKCWYIILLEVQKDELN